MLRQISPDFRLFSEIKLAIYFLGKEQPSSFSYPKQRFVRQMVRVPGAASPHHPPRGHKGSLILPGLQGQCLKRAEKWVKCQVMNLPGAHTVKALQTIKGKFALESRLYI